MSPPILSLLLISLGLGTTITFASSHWLLAWIGLEINTLAITPLMMQHPHPRAVEASTKYFITQATAAAMILFASTTNAWTTGQWNITDMTSPLAVTIITMALSLKLGLAPTHFWLPEVLQGLDLTTGLILSTWQKLAPFALILQLPHSNYALITTLGLLSILVGGWGGLNQPQVRKILAYSSIAHLGWMILITQFSPSLTLLALTTYILMTSSAFLLIKFNTATTINALATTWTKSPALTALTPLTLLSLGGLPPLLGFSPKWMILLELTKQQMILTATAAAMMALLSLYFYLRLSYAISLTTAPNTLPMSSTWRLNPAQLPLVLPPMLIITLTALPLTPTALSLLTP
uniref:NADH dehydrogenase subunit 2 n=1 Tax=Lampris incognitus TaxID=2546036 RepID=UPI0026E303D7|nr:NADH dehydrogenase subunit 2 [Lampris incognitus]WJQ22780.1 NADH dehydrogenase subunit 2 [Lampris incognitus]